MNTNDDNDRNQHRSWRNPGFRHAEHIRRIQFGQRGFLRPEIIQLLEEKAMNGVDIMNRLQEKSHGWYRPSPGSIYPLLEQLEREGLISKNKEGKYELTAAYGEQSGVGGNVASALSSMESNASYLEDLHGADATSLLKSKDRIEKLAKRIETLNAALAQKGGQQ